MTGVKIWKADWKVLSSETQRFTSIKKKMKLHSKQTIGVSTELSTSGSSGSRWTRSTEEDFEMEVESDTPRDRFRFEMLNHTVSKEASLREICVEWGIE